MKPKHPVRFQWTCTENEGGEDRLLGELEARQTELEFQTNSLREALHQLQQSLDHYTDLFQAAPAGYVIFDARARIHEINQTAADLVGIKRVQLIGTPFTFLVASVDLTVFLNHLRRCRAASRKKVATEVRLRARNNRLIPVQLVSLSLSNSKKPALFRTVLTDLSERHQSERETRELTQSLERRVQERTNALQDAVAQLEAFSYSVSHDLRAPLRAMQGFAQALLEDYGHLFDETGRDYARRIIDSAHRMDALVQDLLAYSRLSRADLKLEPVFLENVVDEVLVCLEMEAVAKKATITVRRPLPGVLAHAGALRPALTNLLTNAFKFTKPGMRPEVLIRAEKKRNTVRLWVEDRGIGFHPKYRERVFRVFERLHEPGHYPGTGIGLAIVRKSIERMGGRVGVESKPGRGSRFWIELAKPQAISGQREQMMDPI